MHLRQSTSTVLSFGPFLDKTTGVDLEIGLVSAIDHATTGILLSKNGGALTIRSQAVTASTYDAYGNYRVTLSTTDTNTLGTLRVQFIETATCLPVWQDFMVLPANVWDSLYGADLLQVDVTQLLGTAWATPATAGLTDVNVKQISADGPAADNAEAFFDGTGYAGTGNTIPTVTTLTNLPAIPSNWLTAAGTDADFGTEIGTAVWATATRVLTAGTNIVLAKGVGVTGFTDLSTAQVNAEVVDALATDTYAEPTGAPAATDDLATKIGFIYEALRNKITITSTTKSFFDDAGVSQWSKTLADNGTTFTESEGS